MLTVCYLTFTSPQEVPIYFLGLNYFRGLERKMLKERFGIDKGFLQKQYEMYWPDRDDDRADKAAEIEEPSPFHVLAQPFDQFIILKFFQEDTDADLTGPIRDYDPLDLDSALGFAKALSYVSGERSLEIDPFPRPQVEGWVTEDLLKV